MTPDVVLALMRDSGTLLLYVAGPILGAGLAAGLLVSVLQAVTQVQEPTLSFIPKAVAVLAVLALMGHWMLGQLLGFTTTLLNNLPLYAR